MIKFISEIDGNALALALDGKKIITIVSKTEAFVDDVVAPTPSTRATVVEGSRIKEYENGIEKVMV